MWQNLEHIGTFKRHVETRHGVGIILINVKIVTKYRRVRNILETNRNIAWSRNDEKKIILLCSSRECLINKVLKTYAFSESIFPKILKTLAITGRNIRKSPG